MQRRFHEGALSVPDDWTDETLIIIKGPESKNHNLVVSRDPLPAGTDPAIHVEHHRKLVADSLPDFNERARTPLIVAGKSCVAVEYSWRSPDGPVHQVNLMRPVGDTLVSFTLTASQPFSDGDRRVIRTTLESFVPATELEPAVRR